MARKGPMPKHPDKRQRRNKTTGTLVVLEGGGLAVPEPDEGLSPTLVDEWYAFWDTDVAQAVRESDLPALRRLWSIKDLERRLHASGAKQPIVVGSQGQPVANPALKQADALRSEIRQLEDRFGLNPSARARLGLDTTRLQASLDDMAAKVVESVQEPDPRADYIAAEED